MDADLKNEISKGFKTFKVFEKLNQFMGDFESAEQKLAETKARVEDMVSKEASILSRHATAAADSQNAAARAKESADAAMAKASAECANMIAKAKAEIDSLKSAANAEIAALAAKKDELMRANSLHSDLLSQKTGDLADLQMAIDKAKAGMQSFIKG